MKKILIAFDVDGTLLRESTDRNKPPRAFEDIRSLLVILSKFKNVSIMVWSGGGELYARQVAKELGIAPYVDRYAGKNLVSVDENSSGGSRYTFAPDVKPDIAIDDIQACDLGVINLIVRNK